MPFISIASGGCNDYYIAAAACLFLSYLVTCYTESVSGQETQMNGKEFIRQCANGMSKRFENGFNVNANAQITIVIIFPLFLPVSFIGIVVFQSPCVLQMSHCVCLWN